MSKSFLTGFASLHNSVINHPLTLSEGKVPDWLAGSLVRNGPGLYDLENYHLRHWFDAMAMLHKFDFENGAVYYTNKMLQSDAYRKAHKKGELAYREFASKPHTTFLENLLFMVNPQLSDNAAINVTVIDGRYVALTDAPRAIEFDLQTLSTVGEFKYADKFNPILSTPHPHYDFERQALFSYGTSFKINPAKLGVDFYYNIYRIDNGSATRQIFGQIKTQYPSYMHSFGMTENYIILSAYPMVLKHSLSIIWLNKPVLDDYDWDAGAGTTFYAVSKKDGSVKTWQSESFFAFHHINAFEVGNDIFVDIIGYDHKKVCHDLFIDRMMQPQGGNTMMGNFRRYHLSGNSTVADYEARCNQKLEMPRTNYSRANTHDYRFMYGYGRRADRPNDFYNQLMKIDVQTGQAQTFYSPDNAQEFYYGEPVFVAAPDAKTEDDGVLLSVTLDAHAGNSCLLILDAHSFEQCARLEIPHVVPFGFHGMFFDRRGRVTL
jgi:beta,beta-carotene 9',10'-dioxygenase